MTYKHLLCVRGVWLSPGPLAPQSIRIVGIWGKTLAWGISLSLSSAFQVILQDSRGNLCRTSHGCVNCGRQEVAATGTPVSGGSLEWVISAMKEQGTTDPYNSMHDLGTTQEPRGQSSQPANGPQSREKIQQKNKHTHTQKHTAFQGNDGKVPRSRPRSRTSCKVLKSCGWLGGVPILSQ